MKNNKKTRIPVLRIILTIMPYIFFIFALAMFSLGALRYIENESLLAVFITRRDAVISAREWREGDWSFSVSDEAPEPAEKRGSLSRENRRLVVPFFYVGERIGTIRIADLDLYAPAIRGDGNAQLRVGAGHSLHTYLPGQGSNIMFGAHHTTYFKPLEHAEKGSLIEFETAYGNFIYRIDDIFIIDGNDSSIALPSDEERLTLYTCYPFIYYGNAPERFVVVAGLVESELFE